MEMREFAGAFDPPSAWVNEASFYKHYLQGREINAILEVGVHFGYSLFTFCNDFPDALVMGVDNFSMHDSHEAKHHLAKFLPNFPNARVFEGDGVELGKSWRRSKFYVDIDLLHIDGAHEYDDVKNDFEAWITHVSPGGVVMFHDVAMHADTVGKFFKSLPGTKHMKQNLGVWYKDEE